MIETHVQMAVRFACDHCGKAQKWFAAVDEGFKQPGLERARASAVEEGFVITDWVYGGCARQTCFCKKCAKEAAHDPPR